MIDYCAHPYVFIHEYVIFLNPMLLLHCAMFNYVFLYSMQQYIERDSHGYVMIRYLK